MAEDAGVGTVKQKEVAYHQNQTALGGTQLPMRNLEYTQRVCSQIGVDRQHQENDQGGCGNSFCHVTRGCEAEDQKHGAEGVNDVVNIKAVARTQPVSVSRERPVEAVAKP